MCIVIPENLTETYLIVVISISISTQHFVRDSMAENIEMDLTGVPMILNNPEMVKMIGAKNRRTVVRAARDQEH